MSSWSEGTLSLPEDMSALIVSMQSLSLLQTPEQTFIATNPEYRNHGIPIEILFKIASQTSLETIAAMARSSRRLRAFVKDNSREILNSLIKNHLSNMKVEDLFPMQYNSKIEGHYVPTPHIFLSLKKTFNANPNFHPGERYYKKHAPLYLPGPGFLYMLEKYNSNIQKCGFLIRQTSEQLQETTYKLKRMKATQPSYYSKIMVSYRQQQNSLEVANECAMEYVLELVLKDIKGQYPRVKEVVWYYGAPPLNNTREK